jgi:two-component system, NtrC family, response regulator AtoC
VEQEVIEKVLLKCNWNRKETAKILKISYRALLYKIKDLDLSPPRRK